MTTKKQMETFNIGILYHVGVAWLFKKKTFTNQTLAHVDGEFLKLHSHGIMSIYFSQRYPLIKT
jgi:hypothetical protein